MGDCVVASTTVLLEPMHRERVAPDDSVRRLRRQDLR